MPAPRVLIHDALQIELRLVYPLDAPSGGHGFDAWIFLPNSLGVDEPQFRKELFYEDLTTYIRFQTPRMSLERLLSDDRASPFDWLAHHEEALISGRATPEDHALAVRELRLFAAMYRATVWETVTEITAAPFSPDALPTQLAATTGFLATSQGAVARYRALQQHLRGAPLPESLRSAIVAIDDFLSLHTLEGWFRLLRALGAPPGGAPIADALRAAIRAESDYRAANGLLGAPTDDPVANEPYISRVHLLKKWVLAVLHLQVVSNRRAERVREAAFSFAAAVSMTVAVATQLLALWTVGTPTSPQVGASTLFAFVGLAVGGYIVKDGIKDRLKTFFQAGIPQWLFDRRQDLRIGGGTESFGSVEETVRLVRVPELAPPVAQLRERDEDPLFAPYRADEDIVHYRRRVQVDGTRARACAPEMSAINEFLRINVRHWLRRMDEPVQALARLEPDGSVAQVGAAKTYRVTLVMAQWRDGEAITWSKVSLVLSRAGILRVEDLGGA